MEMTPVKTTKETPLTRLSGAVDRLRKAEAHVCGICATLAGEQVAAEGNPARAPHGSGFLGGIEELADNVSDLADSIINEMVRIEKRI